MQISVSDRGPTNKCWPVSSKGALAGESGGAGKSRKLVYGGRGRVTGMMNIVTAGISWGVLGVELGPPKNRCVSGSPTDASLNPPTLTYFLHF